MENFWQCDYITDDSNINYHIKLFIFTILLLLILLLLPVKHYKNFTCFTDENFMYLNLHENDFTYLKDNKLYIKNNSYVFDVLDYKDNVVKLKLKRNIKNGVYVVILKKSKVSTISFLLGRS